MIRIKNDMGDTYTVRINLVNDIINDIKGKLVMYPLYDYNGLIFKISDTVYTIELVCTNLYTLNIKGCEMFKGDLYDCVYLLLCVLGLDKKGNEIYNTIPISDLDYSYYIETKDYDTREFYDFTILTLDDLLDLWKEVCFRHLYCAYNTIKLNKRR